MSGTVEVGLGHKFGVLAVSASRGGGSPAPIIELPGGLAVTSGLPAKSLDTWESNLGQFHRNELEATNLFLWAVARSEKPEVLDEENERLAKSAYRLYLGLLLAVPYYCNGRLTELTGANADGTARVRSMTTFDRTYYTLGAPQPNLTASKLQIAGRLAQALEVHPNDPEHRMVRAVRAFRQAAEAPELDVRLHQFVRTAEAFVLPANGRIFAERLACLSTGRRRQELRELYTIRSSIEHLHGPYDRLPRSVSGRDRRVRLLMRCVQAEAFSRFLLTHYLLNQHLWPHFHDRKSIKQFWTLSTRELRRIWPTRLAFGALLRDFDKESALQEYDDS